MLRSEQAFLRRINSNDHQAYKEILKFINHQEQIKTTVTQHLIVSTVRTALIKQIKIYTFLPGWGQRDLSWTVGGDVNQYVHLKDNIGTPPKIKSRMLWDPVILLMNVCSVEIRSLLHRDFMFTAQLLTTDKIRNQPRCHVRDEWIRNMCHLDTHWVIIQPSEK